MVRTVEPPSNSPSPGPIGPTGSVRWPHRHLLDVADLAADEIERVLELADHFGHREGARGAGVEPRTELRGIPLVALFHEPSTRTRISFELAARALSAVVVDFTVEASSVVKGESLIDTVRTLDALGAKLLVIRHARTGAAHLAAEHFGGHVVNAGDGWHAHPTQALLDLLTLRRHLPGGAVAGRKVAIVGDVLHSRVARSNIWTLTAAGADVWLAGPSPLLRGFESWARALRPARRLTVSADIDAALRDADAVMALRIQRERMEGGMIASLGDYAGRYGITVKRLRICRPDVVVLHPGPMNEGIEIAPDVAIGPSSLVTEQVANGVAVRMAVLALLASTDPGG